MSLGATQKNTALVIAAHSGDFVWRAAGAIALYVERGWTVKVVCLSYGERGESTRLWRQPGATLAGVKAIRAEETRKAAEILGADLESVDCGDYPLRFSEAQMDELIDLYRSLQPRFVLCHSSEDPANFDHPVAAKIALEARIMAQAYGHKPGGAILGAPPVFMFEPHQTEQCDFKPNLLLDVTSVWEKKRQACEVVASQQYLLEYTTRVALNRGVQAARNSDQKDIKYAEAYQRVYPQVTDKLS